MRNKLLLVFALSFLSLTVRADTAPAAAPSMPPDQVVQQTAKDVFDTVNANKAALQKDPYKLYGMVGKILLPRFDFSLASQLVLGLAWRNATADQRKAFQDAFVNYLTHSYADALVKGNYSEHNVQIEPYRPGSDPTRATVRTKVIPDSGQPIEVDYVLTSKSGEWKAFDVVIEGISYVHNYHDQFAPEVQQKGLDELTKRLIASTAASMPPAAKT